MIYEEEALVSYDVITGMTSGEFEIAIVGKFSTLEINYDNNNNNKKKRKTRYFHPQQLLQYVYNDTYYLYC